MSDSFCSKTGASVSDLSIPSQHNSAKYEFTELQGQYLAFIHSYTKLHRVAPAELDMERYFRVTPPSVHRMVIELERRGLIARTPRRARSIQLLIPEALLPALHEPMSLLTATDQNQWGKTLGVLENWITEQGENVT